jgi:hypothetical protein
LSAAGGRRSRKKRMEALMMALAGKRTHTRFYAKKYSKKIKNWDFFLLKILKIFY